MGAGNPVIDRLVGTRAVPVYQEVSRGIIELPVGGSVSMQRMVEFS